MRAYKRLTGARFGMLTGTQSEIHRLWKFFGVYYQKVPQGRPPDIDWWTHRPETMDVNHTDGFFIIDPEGHWRAVNEGMPDVGGHLAPKLLGLLDAQGRTNLRDPQAPWSAQQALADLFTLMGRRGPKPSGPTIAQVSALDVRAPLSKWRASLRIALGMRRVR